MADLQRTVEIIFQGTDKVGKTVKGINQTLMSFSGDVQDVTQPLTDLTKGIVALEGALLAVGTAYGVYAYSSSVKFESAQLDLQKVMSDSEGSVDQFTGRVFELSNTYAVAADEILQSIANYKQAGFTAMESSNLVKDSLDLVIAGDLEAAEASEILVATLKGFKAPAEDAARVVNILNEVSNRYATSAGELGIGMSKLSPIANQMGFSFEETAGILTPVIEIFRSGDEAATALKTGLLKLIDDSKPVKDALASIGVSQTDANGRLRSGRDILFDVAEAFKTVDQDQKLFLTSQLVGIRQSGKMVEVFDGLAKSQEITAAAMNATGSAAKEVAIRLNGAEIAGDRTRVAFQNLATIIGLKFKDEVKEVINGVTDLENSMAKVVDDGGLEPLFNAMEPQLKKLQSLLEAMAENLPAAFEQIDFDQLITSLLNLESAGVDAFEALFGDIDLSTPEGLAAAIQKVIDGVTSLTNVTTGVVRGIEPFLHKLGELADEFLNLDENSQAAAGKVLGIATAVNQLLGPLQTAGLALNVVAGSMSIMAGKTALDLIKSIAGGGGLTAALSGPGGMVAGLAAAYAGGYALGTVLYDNSATIRELSGDIANFTGKLLGYGDVQAAVNDLKKAGTNLTAEEIDNYRRLHKEIDEVPEQKSIEVDTITFDEALAKVQAVTTRIEDIPESKGVTISTVADQLTIENVGKQIRTAIPDEREVEITPQLRIAELQAQADIVQNAVEWKAKLDIAQVEQATRRVEKAFDSINIGIESTGGLIGNLFGGFGDLDRFEQLAIQSQVAKENELRTQEFELQKKLIDSQTRLTELRADAIERGDGLIRIDSTGLEPALEMVLWHILAKVQIRATDNADEFLLGING